MSLRHREAGLLRTQVWQLRLVAYARLSRVASVCRQLLSGVASASDREEAGAAAGAGEA